MQYITPSELRAQKLVLEQLWHTPTVKGFCYTEQAKDILLRAFNADRLISSRSCVLARETGLSQAQVKQWFYNQRNRH